MKKYATIKRLGMQLEYLIEIEESYPKFIIRAVYQMVHVEKPNKTSGRLHRFEISLNAFILVYLILCRSTVSHWSAFDQFSWSSKNNWKKNRTQQLAVSSWNRKKKHPKRGKQGNLNFRQNNDSKTQSPIRLPILISEHSVTKSNLTICNPFRPAL